MPHKGAAKRISEGLIALLRETGDAVGGTIEFTRRVTVDTLRNARNRKDKAPDVTREAVSGAIQAGSHAGSELGSVAKGAVIGVIRGLAEVTRVTPALLGDAVKAAIRAAKKEGGDIPSVSRSAVEGAIEAGQEVGIKAKEAASAATAAAVESAREIDETLVESVVRALSGTVSGVKVALNLAVKKPVIMILDSDSSSLALLSLQLKKEGYRTLGVSNLDEMDRKIESNRKISLVLVDLTGFDQGIWPRCEKLSQRKIPLLIVSAHRSPMVQRESIKCGARGVFIKPLVIKDLAENIRTLLGD